MDAIDKYKSWLDVPDEDLKAELKAMSDSEIEECFGYDIEFGTGGL